MHLIIIIGPSGSGKTTLSKRILKKLQDGVILNTDNYYKTGLPSQILSKIITSYFDRKISFNYKRFIRDLEFILKNGYSEFSYKYNHKNQSIKKVNKKTKNIKFIILEGIFVQEIFNNFTSTNCILIKLKTNKKTCLKRVIKRDYLERGKSKEEAKSDFLKAWNLFCKNKKKTNSISYLKKIVIRNNSEIKLLLKNITNLVN
tara:strand:+ start:761 stop:1366 length:606 start_codon:yes stop_codon:yes gene_type:complete